MERLVTITQRIDAETTGLKAAIYVHMDLTPEREIKAVRFSHKGKEKDNTLDSILTALGDVVTAITEQEGR